MRSTSPSMSATEVEQLRAENAALKLQIDELRNGAAANGGHGVASGDDEGSCPRQAAWDGLSHGLTKDEIARYSRQLILHNFGVHAQAKLCRGSVLIVGAGGLGSPAALYLAAAGVGRIGIVDKDAVELSNLHRQIIHREENMGQHKSISAAAACTALNSSVRLETHCEGFMPANAVQLVQQYDVVVDASDNAPTRYLISDACAVAKRPLVSGAAIGMDGQLTVYCYGDDVAPRPESCSRCCDAGVLGAVPGVIGTLQAVEAIKVLSGVGDPMSRRLLLVDTFSARFHTVKLRAKSSGCVACGESPSITAQSLASYDYHAFTGQRPSDAAPNPLKLIPPEERMSPAQLKERLEDCSRPCVLIDVRPAEQYRICHLPGALHAPYAKFDAHVDSIRAALAEAAAAACHSSSSGGGGGQAAESGNAAGTGAEEGGEVDLYVVCRRGNDSQRAVARLRQLGIAHGVDVVGGMEGWAQQVDPGFPTY